MLAAVSTFASSLSDEHAESNAIEANAVPKITFFIILQFYFFYLLLLLNLSFAIYIFILYYLKFILYYFKLYLLRLKALFSDAKPLTYNVFIHIRPIINSYIEAGTTAGIVSTVASASSIILVIRNDEVEIDDEMHITEMTPYGNRVNLC